MAWNDPTDLKFDVEKIASMRAKLDSTAQELKKLSETLLSEIEELKKEWNTPAGEAFKEKFQDGWSEQVNEYIRIISAVDDLLQVAETEYAQVENAVNALAF